MKNGIKKAVVVILTVGIATVFVEGKEQGAFKNWVKDAGDWIENAGKWVKDQVGGKDKKDKKGDKKHKKEEDKESVTLYNKILEEYGSDDHIMMGGHKGMDIALDDRGMEELSIEQRVIVDGLEAKAYIIMELSGGVKNDKLKEIYRQLNKRMLDEKRTFDRLYLLIGKSSEKKKDQMVRLVALHKNFLVYSERLDTFLAEVRHYEKLSRR